MSSSLRSLLSCVVLASSCLIAKDYPLDAQGFVHHWLFTGAEVKPYAGGAKKADDVFNELRKAPWSVEPPRSFEEVPPETAPGFRLRPAAQREKLFLDDYRFHRKLSTLEAHAVTALVSAKERTVAAIWWVGRGRTSVWINGTALPPMDHFKSQPGPFRVALSLRAGTNLVFVRRLGVGDKNQVFETGLQIQDSPGNLRVVLPGDPSELDAFYEAEEWLATVGSDGPARLRSSRPAPADLSIFDGTDVQVWKKGDERFSWSLPTPGAPPLTLRMVLPVGATNLSRTVDWLWATELIPPPGGDLAAHRERVLRDLPREKKGFWPLFRGFQWMNRLRKGDSPSLPEMRSLIADMIAQIANRDGTSDFQLAAAVRLLKVDGDKLPSDQRDALKACLLDFRYWEDEKGVDTLSFTSENHKVMLHSAQRIAGLLFPDETFARSGRTGAEQARIAKERLEAWMALRESAGFQEFLAPAYHGETAIALLNVHDFCEDESLRARAGALLDTMLRFAAKHSIGGFGLGANGRCYRRELLPAQSQAKQAFLSWSSTRALVATAPQLMAFATSDYRTPKDVDEIIERPAEETFRHGGTELYLKKTPAYLVSSTTLPVPAEARNEWSVDFVPGSFSYQGHLWEISLGGSARVFVTHPGSTSELLDARPGYWVGEGTAPTLRAEKGRVYEIFRTADNHAVSFTHAWWPEPTFDESRVEGNWAFARKGDAYVALWCSSLLSRYDNAALGCELRADGRKAAWYARAGSKAEDGSFTEFIRSARKESPSFDSEALRLQVNGGEALRWPESP